MFAESVYAPHKCFPVGGVHHTCAETWGDQKRAWDPLGLKPQVVVSYSVSVGNPPWALSKSSSHS